MLSTTSSLRVLTNPVITRSIISSTVLRALLLSRNYLRRSYSSFNKSTMLNQLRYKSSVTSGKPAEINIENAMFMNYKMNQVELENYNHGLKLKILKEKLSDQREAIEELEKAVMEFKSNFL